MLRYIYISYSLISPTISGVFGKIYEGKHQYFLRVYILFNSGCKSMHVMVTRYACIGKTFGPSLRDSRR